MSSGDQQRSEVKDDFFGLSVEKMAELEDVRFARVTVSELKAPGDSTSGKLPGKGKPPRPLGTKKW